MPSGRPQAHVQIVDGLIAADPEAESLRLAALHSHALAEGSRAAACEADRIRRAARRRFETLRNIHDPRRLRHVHLVLGLAGCAVAAASLLELNGIELRGTLAGSLASPVVLAATGVWLGGAWWAALARREEQSRLLALLAAGAVLLAGLLAGLYDLGAPPRWLAVLPGIVVAVFIAGAVLAASALIERTEPAFLTFARWRWRRAEAWYDAAAGVAADDAESAAAAMTAWLNLVRAHVAAVAGRNDGLMSRCLGYAAHLVTAEGSFAVFAARFLPRRDGGGDAQRGRLPEP